MFSIKENFAKKHELVVLGLRAGENKMTHRDLGYLRDPRIRLYEDENGKDWKVVSILEYRGLTHILLVEIDLKAEYGYDEPDIKKCWGITLFADLAYSRDRLINNPRQESHIEVVRQDFGHAHDLMKIYTDQLLIDEGLE